MQLDVSHERLKTDLFEIPIVTVRSASTFIVLWAQEKLSKLLLCC